MKVKNSEVKVVENLSFPCRDKFILEKSRGFSLLANSARTFKINPGDYENSLRKAVFSFFVSLHRKGKKNAVVFVKSCPENFPAKDTAKVIAQEIFRYFFKYKNLKIKRIVVSAKGKKIFSAFNKYIYKYLDYMVYKISQGPFLTVDGIVEYKSGIVLVKRSNPPLGWALPGGFVDYGESVETAVVREIKEETNLDFLKVKQFKVYSDPKRDPRFHTASVVFSGKGKGPLKGASDALSAEVFAWDNLPENIAFDHKRIIEDYKKSRKL